MTDTHRVVRTRNTNGTYRYTLNGEVFLKGSRSAYEWASIYRRPDEGPLAAFPHTRRDLALRGNKEANYCGWTRLAAVEIIDGDAA
jgi:hypothetical protein